MYPILRRKTLLVLLWHVCDLPRHALITHSWDSQIPTVYHYPNSPCPLARTRRKQSTLILATNSSRVATLIHILKPGGEILHASVFKRANSTQKWFGTIKSRVYYAVTNSPDLGYHNRKLRTFTSALECDVLAEWHVDRSIKLFTSWGWIGYA